jgi:NAD(P)-dependent dehydrogenase (short-subunit alcohol dehydrogenase family)
MDIVGKRVLVTGGSSGIGFEIARELLARKARVLISGRRADAITSAVEELRLWGEIEGVAADVTTPEGRKLTIDTALKALGGLDILINNAGGVRAGRLERIEEEAIRQMVEVNLSGPMLLTRAALPSLRESGDAMIVNVSSAIGQVGMAFYAPYAAVKAGIAHFGEALRRELDGEGIHVLTVYPTATDTPMMSTSGINPPEGRDSAKAVAIESVDAIAAGRLEVVRGGAERLELVKKNCLDPAAVDIAMRPMKAPLEGWARDHSAL